MRGYCRALLGGVFMKEEQKREFIAILVFLLAVYLGFGLFTYKASNNPIVSNEAGDYPLIGRIGTVLAYFLKFVFGWPALLIPVFLIYIAVKLFKSESAVLKDFIGMFSLVLSLSVLTALIKSGSFHTGLDEKEGMILATGFIGWYSAYFLFKAAGNSGTVIVSVLLLILSAFLLSNFLLRTFWTFIKNRFFNAMALMKERKLEREKATKERKDLKRVKRKEKRTTPPPVPKKKIKEKKEPPAPPPPEKMPASMPLPPLDILEPPSKGNIKTDADALERTGKLLIEKLRSLGIEAELHNYIKGPNVTRYEITLASGQRVSQIASLENDIAYALAKSPVRIIAPIPGKQAVGVEIPNDSIRMISLREIFETKEYSSAGGRLRFGIGCTIDGSYIVGRLEEMPHLLIAGSTGSGKSVMIKSIIDFFLMQYSPAEMRMLLIDPKRVEMTKFGRIPHLLCNIVVEPKDAAQKLAEMVERMTLRYKIMADYGFEHIEKFNKFVEENKNETEGIGKLPYIVVIIDELADLMIVSRTEVETSIARLAQLARAVGIHLILATQRPSVDIITGVIKSNFPVRMGFRVASKVDSRTIFDKNGAEALLGKGDLLYIPPGSSDLTRAQAPLPKDNETLRIVKFWCGMEDAYIPDWEAKLLSTEKAESRSNGTGGIDDDLFFDAVELFLKTGKPPATSYLQTMYKIGFNRAARIINLMEEKNIISDKGKSGKREMMITQDQWTALKEKLQKGF